MALVQSRQSRVAVAAGLLLVLSASVAPAASLIVCGRHRHCNQKADDLAYCSDHHTCGTCANCFCNKDSITGKCPARCSRMESSVTCTQCQAETGVDYRGKNLADGMMPAESATACIELCKARADCLAFTYLESNGRCYLKAGMGRRKERQGAVSGTCVSAAATVTTTESTTAVPMTITNTPPASVDSVLPGPCRHQCNPGRSWADSYSVDGRCYCKFGAHSFDHGIGDVIVQTPAGRRTVRQVCEAIRARHGEGSPNGRKYYNDVQCGHGPANNAGDEDRDACPGRVDMGSAGCRLIGPPWDLQGVFGA